MPDQPTLHDEIRELDADAARYDDPAEARRKAMDYLARREYGLAELKRKLGQAGFSRDAAGRAADGLAADGLQDDARFAEGFVQARANRGKGPVVIRSELSQRGLDGHVIDRSLESAAVDWRELAREVRLKKFGADEPGSFKEKARQMRFLQYRGFDPEQIRAALGDDD